MVVSQGDTTLTWALIAVFTAYVIVSLWYIHKLHTRIRGHERVWVDIERLADHNRDGDVIVHVRHIGEDDVD